MAARPVGNEQTTTIPLRNEQLEARDREQLLARPVPHPPPETTCAACENKLDTKTIDTLLRAIVANVMNAPLYEAQHEHVKSKTNDRSRIILTRPSTTAVLTAFLTPYSTIAMRSNPFPACYHLCCSAAVAAALATALASRAAT